MTHFNATDLIPLKNGRRTKKVRHFLDNRLLSVDPKTIIVYRGRGAHTDLPINLLPDYLLWLTPKTRKALLEGTHPHYIMGNIRDYW